jgi:hypothetical protein
MTPTETPPLALQAGSQWVALYAELPCAPELLGPLAAAAQRIGVVPVAAVEAHRQVRELR